MSKSKYDEYIKCLGDNESVCKEMLKMNNNYKTKVKIEENIKGNYYMFLNDTIYISSSKNSYDRICVIAHEVIHSMQSKILQWINFLSSNLEIILFIIILILYMLSINILSLMVIYILAFIISFTVRTILELDATIKSIPLSKKYLSKYFSKENTNVIVSDYRTGIKSYFPLFLLSLYKFKIIRIIIAIILI